MYVVCLDVEGVLLPEIWIALSEKTGIGELRVTTRDEPDYDLLMKKRLRILDEHRLTLRDIQEVIAAVEPLDGARAFLDDLRRRTQVFLLSDTYIEFAMPLMKKLGWPTLLCNTLVVSKDNRIAGYTLRQKDGKRKAVAALKSLGYGVAAAGDSYNDTTMLSEANVGILFRPPPNVARDFPRFPVASNYDELNSELNKYI